MNKKPSSQLEFLLEFDSSEKPLQEQTISEVELIFYTQEEHVKVVQLYLKDKPVIAIGSADSSYHRKILERCLKEKGLKYTLDGDMPSLTGEDYHVVGMGRAFLNQKEKKFFEFNGYSSDYQIEINEEHKHLVMNYLKTHGWEINPKLFLEDSKE